MSHRPTRRELFGFLRRPGEPTPTPTPAPAPVVEQPTAPGFSLDAFYGHRGAAPATLPHFAVRSPVTAPTTGVGVGLIAAAPAAPAATAAASPVPAAMVPVVLAHACLATRSFCSVCVERCPRPGAIVVAGGRPQVVAAACDGCGRCVAACPAPVLAFALVPRTAPAPSPAPELP